jgi:hypothetical protein
MNRDENAAVNLKREEPAAVRAAQGRLSDPTTREIAQPARAYCATRAIAEDSGDRRRRALVCPDGALLGRDR